ncbi:hypothetical protein ACFQ0M_10075 [Kitasatospora aburaviensis]
MRPLLVAGEDAAAPAPPEPPAPVAPRIADAPSPDTGERANATAWPIRRTVATRGAGPTGNAAAEPREPGATGPFKAPEARRRGEEPPTGTTDREQPPGRRSANAAPAPGGAARVTPAPRRPGLPPPPVTVSIGRMEVTVVQRPAVAPGPRQGRSAIRARLRGPGSRCRRSTAPGWAADMSAQAIFATTGALRGFLKSALSNGRSVTLLPPGEDPPVNGSGVNVYLYQVSESPYLRNSSFPGTAPAPRPGNSPSSHSNSPT